MPRESAIVRSILKTLNALECGKAIKIHGSRYVETGTPDIFSVVSTRAFLLEVKRSGERATKIQEFRLLQWGLSGAVARVVHSAEEVLDVIALTLYSTDEHSENSDRGMRCSRCKNAGRCVLYAKRGRTDGTAEEG